MSEKTLATLRRGYDAYNRGDPSVMLKIAEDLATPDVEWGATGAFPGVGSIYRGPQAMQEWMEVIRSEWERFEVSLNEVLHDGDEILVVDELLVAEGVEAV